MSDIFDTRFENGDVEVEDSLIKAGEEINLMQKDPALKSVKVAMGWEPNAFDGVAIDLDVSAFLLNRDHKTRVDEDFVFYNNMEGSEGAVRHRGDSRHGAGAGDDEVIEIDLQGVPFDVMHIAFVLSVYKGAEREQTLSHVRGAYIRVVNAETGHQILRFQLNELTAERSETAMIVGFLNREGPKWHFTADTRFEDGGLTEIAIHYGLDIIKQ